MLLSGEEPWAGQARQRANELTPEDIRAKIALSPYSSLALFPGDHDCCGADGGRIAKGGVTLGTSIMACSFAGGVVLGADSRTTTGSYIANRVSDKLTPVWEPRVWCCRSGSAADTQALSDIVRYQMRLLAVQQQHSHVSGPDASSSQGVTVKQAACLFRALAYKYREQLQAGIILAGLDPAPAGSKGSSQRGQVWNMPLGGSLHAAPFAIGGSGSSYIYGFCDANYRDDFDRAQAEHFVLTSLALAMSRDGSSGGVVRLVVLTYDDGCAEGVCLERRTVTAPSLPVFYQN